MTEHYVMILSLILNAIFFIKVHMLEEKIQKLVSIINGTWKF